MIYIVFLAYAALAALAAVLRWRYRIWLALMLFALGAVFFQWEYWHDARTLDKATAYTEQLLAGLRARAWPEQPQELARLIATFRVLHDPRDANALQTLYRLDAAHRLAGEPVERFGSVTDALAWQPPEPKPGSLTSPWQEGERAQRRAIQDMLETQAPRLSGWPPELARDAPLDAGAREIAPGVWLAARPENPHVGTLRFPLSVHNRGEGRIANAQVTVKAVARAQGNAPAARRALPDCHATLHDIAPGETKLFSCTAPVSLGTDPRPLQRLLDNIEALRSGELDAQLHAGGSLDAALLKAPDAEPLIPEELAQVAMLRELDKQRQARRNQLAPTLALVLLLGSIFLAGMALPGLRRGCLSAPATVALSAAGFLVAAVAGWFMAERTPGVAGWELIIAVFTAFEYGVPFIAGLVFGNLIYLRQPVTRTAV